MTIQYIYFTGFKAPDNLKCFQWDRGQKLLFAGIDMPSYFEVHFANDNRRTAYRRVAAEVDLSDYSKLYDGKGWIVDIPSESLQHPGGLKFWITEIDDTASITKYEGEIEVIKRAQPEDIIIDEDDMEDSLNRLINLMNEPRGIASIEKTDTSGIYDTYTVTYTDDTTSTFIITNGAKGDPGTSIQSVELYRQSGVVDTYHITLTDGTVFPFTVTNGVNGTNGTDGINGFSPEITETQTATGYDITITTNTGTNTISLHNGQDGTDGTNGTDGVTPVKGVDYYTSAEIEAVVTEVLSRVTDLEQEAF